MLLRYVQYSIEIGKTNYWEDLGRVQFLMSKFALFLINILDYWTCYFLFSY